ncbi:MAG TPA: lysozyme [Methanosarcina sp.]|nr:lysozyme [Methanosarcina sp.]
MTSTSRVSNLIKSKEGLSLKPYLCPAKIPTIGYGTTQYPNGTKVTMKDKPITQSQAEAYLSHDIQQAEKDVLSLVKVPLKQGQFDALVDFVYNLGSGALQNSTLLKKINVKDFTGASDEFPKWVHAGGIILNGLVTRRATERAWFLEP